MTDVDKPKPALGRIHMYAQLDDGTELDVWVESGDMARYDKEAIRRGWPGMEAAPALYMQFVTWAALTRQGLIPPCIYDVFENKAHVSPVVDDDDDAAVVGPTRRAPEPA